MLSPAERLDKVIVSPEWIVLGPVPKSVDGTGAFFSVGYFVESASTGQRAFLKALNFGGILERASNKTAALEEALRIYNFEKQVCMRCAAMDRVVKILDAGEVQLDNTDPLSIVPYLVFEEANGGDVRTFLNASQQMDVAWALRCMHQIAVGLSQMHGGDIAHQDLKPSNVLMFGSESSKLGDLGRAASKTENAPHDEEDVAGSKLYAPPERLYAEAASGWGERRLACDLYLLGSMLTFFFAQTSMTALLMDRVDEGVRPRALDGRWDGDFASALPHLQAAFATALIAFGDTVPTPLRAELVLLLQYLCDPDPRRRGHPEDLSMRHGNRYSLEQFVSRFDRLAKRAEARVGLASG